MQTDWLLQYTVMQIQQAGQVASLQDLLVHAYCDMAGL